jgi:uncharacterized protein YukE
MTDSAVAFPDTEVEAAIDELQRIVARLDDAIARRQHGAIDALATWQGRCRTGFEADHDATQHAAIEVVEELRQQIVQLRRAQDAVAEVRHVVDRPLLDKLGDALGSIFSR